MVFRLSPSPVTCVAGSSSRELRLSFRVLRFAPARHLSVSSSFHGVCSSSRHQPSESTFASFPSSLSSVRGVSHALDGLLLRWLCRFISPRSHVQDSPSRGFPFSTAAPPFSGRCPLAVMPRSLQPTCADCAKNVAPPSGLCSMLESVALRKGLASVKLDPLLGFSSSRFSVCWLSPRLHEDSAHDLLRGTLVHSHAGSSAFFNQQPDMRYSLTCLHKRGTTRTPTRSRFATYLFTTEAVDK